MSSNARTLVIVGGLAALLLAVVLVAVISRSPGGEPPSRIQAAKASSIDDWVTSVCRPGTHMSGGHPARNATSGSWCVSKVAGTSIDFYTYDSEESRDADLQYGQGSYATLTDGGTYWLVRSYASPAPAALEPLGAFGFVITTMKP